MTVLRSAFVTLLAIALLTALPTAASAKFTRTSATALSVSSDTLAPPTGVNITCNRTLGFVVKWTATSDVYATGYTITGSFLGSGSVSVSGRTTTSYSYLSSVPSGATVQLVSVYKSWTSTKTAAVGIYC